MLHDLRRTLATGLQRFGVRLEVTEALLMRQAVLARMERDAELAAQTGQPIQAHLQRARQIIAESGFTGLFEALKRAAALPAAFAPLVQLVVQSEEVNRGE